MLGREGVDGQFRRNLIDPKRYLPCIISDAASSKKTFSKITIVIRVCLLQICQSVPFCVSMPSITVLSSYFYVSLNFGAVLTV